MTTIVKRGLFAVTSIVSFIAFILPVILPIFIYRRRLFSHKRRIVAANRPSFTAEMVCIYRAAGNALGLCEDSFAIHILEWDARILAHFIILFGKGLGMRRFPFERMALSLSTRTKEFDRYIASSGAKQVVIMGAGFDCRAFRLAALNAPDVRVFEVDAPSTQAAKTRLIGEVFKRHPELFVSHALQEGRVRFVPVDFSSSEYTFIDKLVEQGFDPKAGEPIAFLLEGVISYLSREEIRRTMELVSGACKAAPVTFALNCISKVDSPAAKRFERFLSAVGEERKFSVLPGESLGSFFEACGFEEVRVRTMDEAAKEFYPRMFSGEEEEKKGMGGYGNKKKLTLGEGLLVSMRVKA